MICEKCGAEIELGKIYCPECGFENSLVPEYNVAEDADFIKYMQDITVQDGEDVGLDDSSAKTVVMKPWYVVLAVISCVLVFLGCCYFIYYSYTNKIFVINDNQSDEYFEAVSLMTKGSEGKAYEAFDKLYEKTSDTNYLFYQYKCAKSEGNTKDQKKILENVLQNDAENSYAVAGLIDIYLQEKDFDSFYRLYAEKPQYANLFVTYAIPEPIFVTVPNGYRVGDTLTIKAIEGVNIYYTIDGTDPKDSGKIYVQPILLTAGDYLVKARAVDSNGMYSPMSELSITVKNY